MSNTTLLPVTTGTLPLTILVQGGIASGKSTVAKLIAAEGGTFVDCDGLGHEALADPTVQAQLRAAFGDEIFSGDDVDRPALGKVVFSDEAALAKLEALVHPWISGRVQAAVEAERAPAGETRRVVVIDAAVAEKMNLDQTIDLKVFVDVELETRRARAATRGWQPGELERREARQRALSEKRSEADLVINNDGDLAKAEQDVKRFWTDVVDSRR